MNKLKNKWGDPCQIRFPNFGLRVNIVKEGTPSWRGRKEKTVRKHQGHPTERGKPDFHGQSP
jgi:hypothetical protein